ncbi:hypothetical protein GCM10009786_21960 [Leucobacter alluvii]|uniref:Uncharacterized protein n=1 Tax=Leucobacter alluvii TaxID=340321 RepID=A0ABN3B7W1_9MICO
MPPARGARREESEIPNLRIGIISQEPREQLTPQPPELGRPGRRIALDLKDAVADAHDRRVLGGCIAGELGPFPDQPSLLEFNAPSHVARDIDEDI